MEDWKPNELSWLVMRGFPFRQLAVHLSYREGMII